MNNIQYNNRTIRLRPLFYTISLLLGSVFFSGCENFVEVGIPNSQLTGEAVFKDAGTAKAAMAHIYNGLRGNTLVTGDINGISILLGNYADELTYFSSSTVLPERDFFQNSLISSNSTLSTIWDTSYNLIYATNAVLEGVSKSSDISEEDKNQLEGEALFVRAYIHFYLVNLYGAIPYITTTDYRVNTSIGKLTPETLYPLLIGDLQDAKDLLSDAYVGSDRVRPNRSVARALLARVYLYTQKWQMAEEEATSIIGNTALYTWVDNLDNVFLKNSTGTLWQLMPSGSGQNTLEARQFIFLSGPPPYRALTEELVASFEPADQRKTHWIGSASSGTETWYFPYKYKQNNTTPASVEYSILFRLEELYFIRSEARAHQTNLDGAREDLNKIRNRAGLPNTTANTQQTLLQAILQERRVEFFTELGHRWFDLKRTGQANTILNYKPGWDATDILWPLPEKELLLNPNLRPQNSGY